MRIPLLSLVALTEDLPDERLTRGQIGTVLEHLERDGDRALLVEFSDEQGQTHAMVPLRPEQLLVLHRSALVESLLPGLRSRSEAHSYQFRTRTSTPATACPSWLRISSKLVWPY